MDISEDLFSKYSLYIGPNKLSKSSLDRVFMDSTNESSLMNRYEAGSKLLEPASQRFIKDDSLVESMNTLSKEDLDNLFGPMYKEYFEKRSSEMSINFAAQQVHNHENSPLTSLIIVKKHEVPPIVTTSEEQTSPISLHDADESN
ncbi:hypothetical protein Tco_1307271 [Tanacetum coccineum]